MGKRVIVVTVFAVVLLTVITGSMLYYASTGNKGNNSDNSTLATATYSPTPNSPDENLTIIPLTSDQYNSNWNFTVYVQNVGNTNATIANVIIGGQPYKNVNPTPLVSPSIENGYILQPNQNVTIAIQDFTAPQNLQQGNHQVYFVTASGNSYEFWLATMDKGGP